jgi:dienelactone hydrolase
MPPFQPFMIASCRIDRDAVMSLLRLLALALTAVFCAQTGAGASDGPAPAVIPFASASPVQPADVLDGLANDPPVTVSGTLDLPPGASGRVPAMLIVHGSGGIGSREEEYQRELNAIGIATFRTDSFRPRGVTATYDNQRAVSTYSMVADAFNALKLLAAHPRIDSKRIGIMGFSKGGSTAFLTAFEPFRRAGVGTDDRFAVHLPFYRGCMYDVAMPRTTAPIREFIGGADDYTGVEGCVAYAERQRAAGHDHEVVVYPGAHHGFNMTREPFHCSQCVNFAACHFKVAGDGSIVDGNTGLPYGPNTRSRIFAACTHRGATVGRDPKAASQSLDTVKGYLRRVFAL